MAKYPCQPVVGKVEAKVKATVKGKPKTNARPLLARPAAARTGEAKAKETPTGSAAAPTGPPPFPAQSASPGEDPPKPTGPPPAAQPAGPGEDHPVPGEATQWWVSGGWQRISTTAIQDLYVPVGTVVWCGFQGGEWEHCGGACGNWEMRTPPPWFDRYMAACGNTVAADHD